MHFEPGTPLSDAVKAARSAALRGNVLGVDLAYAKAAKISPAVAHDHCATLLNLGAIAKAARRCDEYLGAGNDTTLRILRAQIRSAATDHVAAERDVRELRKLKLTELEQARLARVAALAAADRYDYPTAESELDAAERHFSRAGRPEHLEHIGRDRLLLDVRRGARVSKLRDRTPRTPAEFLQRAAALRREVRYEEALALMTRCVTSYQIEPALRFAVLYELTVLLVMTRQAGTARRLFPLLAAAAGPEVISQLPDATHTLRPERRLTHVRRLIAKDELLKAEGMLGEGNSPLWHLTAAELAYAQGRLEQAAQHFEIASRAGHAELTALALRKLGDTFADAGHEDIAAGHWAESHRVEEDLADHRDSPSIKLRMLRVAPDVRDGRVRAAARRARRDGRKALAGLVVAVEAARAGPVPTEPRPLPGFADLRAARRWLAGTTRHLPKDQVVWMMHATPDQLHHVLVGRRKITHVTTSVHIGDLTDTIRRLKTWKPKYDKAILGALLAELAGLIGLRDVVAALPPQATRIVVVAGDVLADVPLAGLPVPDTNLFLGMTHALSTLPCLSALRPRQRAARAQRGDEAETCEKASQLRRTLEEGRSQRIRIDAQAAHDHMSPDQSWLQFADERVSVEALGKMDFSTCGTVVLGACESGVVHAVTSAGAGAVVAARWQAEETAARQVLDTFDRHLAKLPRDRALQHALVEVADRHPADWACWSLHGDAGFQTSAGPLRRRLRKNGDPVPLETRPKVFLSFAGKDRAHAEQLRAELESRNVNAYLAEDEIGPGDNAATAVDETLATSDYHVLLWSANTPRREPAAEWTAAFTLEMTRRRAFLFIVRLDEEPLPPLLAPRKHIDLVDAADRLVATWRSDRKSELPVFPQPVPPKPDGPTVAISVRSHDLGTTHVVMIPLHLTGASLYRAVFDAMRLPTEQITFDGTIGMRFSYELYQQNEPIPDDESIVELASDVVDITVRVESFGGRGSAGNREYRQDEELDEGVDVDQQRMLLVAAFRHLLP
ncbi:CHAT domain-containing protein [Lentzea albidocapillata subsp. violacea]|uniref:CHAT domain-containing protein n=1 Tax=Lentzea albidocapillata subsp. violacea TaxID=128104 RepID=A0A1G8XKK5_9PSEU|nr:TIR domain-containing protein [Lentzea albidocapillata]SDJ90300.1 CHAT domain-containing protein [Lentzea albidocapillata subsp. violacea]